jgi:hypothetical protein
MRKERNFYFSERAASLLIIRAIYNDLVNVSVKLSEYISIISADSIRMAQRIAFVINR